MSRPVTTIPATRTLADARLIMQQERIRHLVVVEKHQVIGVLSDRDLAHRHDGVTVGDAMTRVVAMAAPDDTLRKAANLMRGRTIGCLPILANKRLVGLVTTSDLLAVLGRGTDRPSHAERHALSHRVAHRKSHGAYGTW